MNNSIGKSIFQLENPKQESNWKYEKRRGMNAINNKAMCRQKMQKLSKTRIPQVPIVHKRKGD
jgi:hypothetical protein